MRSDVAIPRCASPERDAPDAFGALQAPARESGGVFLPTARLDGPFNHDQHHRTGGLPLEGSPTRRTPVHSRPTPGRHAHPAARRGRRLRARRRRSAHHRLRAASHRPEGKSYENDPAFHLDDPGNCRDSPQAIDTGRSALGRAATTLGPKPFRRRPDEQGSTIEAGSDAFAY